MSRYRKIDVRIWNDEKFRGLNFFAQDLWIYILTNPQTNQIGLYVYRHEFALSDLLPRWYSAAELFAHSIRDCGGSPDIEGMVGTDMNGLREGYWRAWEALISASMIAYDEPSRVLFVVNFLRYEPPCSNLNVLGWKGIFAELPSNQPFLPQLLTSLSLNVAEDKRDLCLKAFAKAIPKPYPKPYPKHCLSQEQEQEQEQEHTEPASPPLSGLLSSQADGGDARARKKFAKPTLAEVTEYCRERVSEGKPDVDPQQWYDHYESNGWRVGKNPMKDWKAAIRTWESTRKQEGDGKPVSRVATEEDMRNWRP